jgi:glutamine amidotransferase
LDSVLRAFRACGVEARVAVQPADLDGARGIVLPGVGFFAPAMQRLRDTGLLPALERKVLDGGTPLLGICLGFQMLTRHSEEGDAEGLGWIDGETKRFEFAALPEPPKVPHIGWNDLSVRQPNPLFEGVPRGACFYFAHSYCVSCRDDAAVVATTAYGSEFVSAAAKGNIFGTQFHPEKSHDNGLQVIRNFAGLAAHA